MSTDFRIGHFTDKKNITGCTVIICPPETIASCHIAGSAPGSRETALLAPERKINEIHALLLTGGSAFGLAAAGGVMRYLEEMGKGYKTGFAIVPLVPAAVIYDMNIGNSQARPKEDNAYMACRSADSDFTSQGTIGAGTGATVGKWAGIGGGMKGGLGIFTIREKDLWLTAVSVVNAVGDIIDEGGKTIAGALDDEGKLLAAQTGHKRWQQSLSMFSENTVLSAILTNASLSKLETYLLSCRAQNGLARAVIPATTSYDGDIIFTLAAGKISVNPDFLFEMGAEALRLSIINAVMEAESLGGYPAVRDLPGK